MAEPTRAELADEVETLRSEFEDLAKANIALRSEVARQDSERETLQSANADLITEAEVNQELLADISTQIHAETGEYIIDRLNAVLLEGDQALEELDLIRERLNVADDVKVSDAVKVLAPGPVEAQESKPVRVCYVGGGTLGFTFGGSYHSISAAPVLVSPECAEWALSTYAGQIVLAEKEQA